MKPLKIQALHDFLGHLSKREKFIFYAAAFFISVTILDRLIISPVSHKMAALNNDIKERENDIKKDLRILAQKDRILAETAKYKSFMGDSKSNDDEQVTSTLKEIEVIASQSSVYLVDMKPGNIKEVGTQKKILINLDCEAQMEQLVNFMYNIENSNSLLSIGKYQLSPKSKESSVAKCSISVYKVVTP